MVDVLMNLLKDSVWVSLLAIRLIVELLKQGCVEVLTARLN